MTPRGRASAPFAIYGVPKRFCEDTVPQSNAIGMTPTRYREALTIMSISQRQLSQILHCNVRLTCHWGLGKAAVPAKIAAWLEQCIELRKKYPWPTPPRDWLQRDPRFTRKRHRERAEAEAQANLLGQGTAAGARPKARTRAQSRDASASR